MLPALSVSLAELGEVRIVVTQSAKHFFAEGSVAASISTDEDEWAASYQQGSDILHIELRNWADVLVIAPLSANTLAKIAHGQCDNLLTCVVRAWNMEKPIVLAPAMNTQMWRHPATEEHLQVLKRWYGEKLSIVDPVAKRLACGETGVGALAPIDQIRAAVQRSTRESAVTL